MLLGFLLVFSGCTSAALDSRPRDVTDSWSGLAWVDEADLPSEARDTLALIDKGGPYPYPNKDGDTFFNNEGLLPKQQRGYYREYTVPTPGRSGRGARRIVTGERDTIFFYTADHYRSFRRVRR